MASSDNLIGKFFVHQNMASPPNVVRVVGTTPRKVRVETIPLLINGNTAVVDKISAGPLVVKNTGHVLFSIKECSDGFFSVLSYKNRKYRECSENDSWTWDEDFLERIENFVTGN